MNSGIYVIHSILDDKFYLGSAINLNRRYGKNPDWAKHHNIHLARAVKKYGKENFRMTVIHECDSDKLRIIEQIYLDYLRENMWGKTYNISESSSGGNLGPEVCAKISKNNSMYRPEVVEKVKKSLIGHKVSKETREKIRKSVTGFKHTTEVKRKMSENCCMKRPEIARKKSISMSGIGNSNSKLVEKEILEIRKLAKEQPYCELSKRARDATLGKKYNVSGSMIRAIIQRDSWRHI